MFGDDDKIIDVFCWIVIGVGILYFAIMLLISLS